MTDAKTDIKKPAADDGRVMCRVLKNGDGKISKGIHDLDGEHYFAKGDEFHAEKGIADLLEDRGFIEIQ